MNKKEAISVSRVEIVSFIAHYSCLSFLLSSGSCLLGALKKIHLIYDFIRRRLLDICRLTSAYRQFQLPVEIPGLAKELWVVHTIGT